MYIIRIFAPKILILLFLCITVFAQEQKINISVTPTPTPTPEIVDSAYLDDLEIDPSGRFPALVRVVGKVIDVHDGDTIKLLDDKKQQYKCRFNGIDAPELKQDFGNRSQKSLADLVAGKQVTIEYDKIDKYGRFVCKVLVGDLDVNLEQVKRGMAWHYKKYQNEQSETDRIAYSEAEINAKNNKLGLWLQPDPTEPSAWRRGENNPNLDGVPKGAIVGNTNSQIYHTPGCSTYAKVSPKNRIVFLTEKEAVDKGYKLAGGCESTLPVEQRTKPTTETGRIYQTGPKGGCYYLNASGKKVYVDKSKCQ